MIKKYIFIGMVLLSAMASLSLANITFNFEALANQTTDLAFAETAQQQLFLDVAAQGDSAALLTFRNVGPDTGIITEVHFTDNSLQPVTSPAPSAGSNIPSPALSVGMLSDSVVTNDFASFSPALDPVAPLGIDPGDSMSISYGLQVGQTFDDFIQNLTSKSLQVSIVVQDDVTGNTGTFINSPLIIPVPGAVLLASIGIASFVWIRKKNML